jgi:hypothetical protein
MLALQLSAAAASIVGCIAIALYVTWRFLRSIRGGDRVAPSFREWLKGLFEAVWGL